MTDNEVPAWLTEEERAAWEACGQATRGPWTWDEWGDMVLPAALRALAEVRRAALGLLDYADGRECMECGRYTDETHAPDCIFSTMPRPK